MKNELLSIRENAINAIKEIDVAIAELEAKKVMPMAEIQVCDRILEKLEENVQDCEAINEQGELV